MRPRRNEKGFATLTLGVILAVVGFIGVSISLNHYVQSVKSLKRLRIKQALSIREFIIRKTAVQPSSYLNCQSNVGFSSCQPDPNVWGKLNEYPLAFAQCSSEISLCGVELLNPVLSNTGVFTATLRYTGNDFNFRPIEIRVNVPSEVLQSSKVQCNNGLFNGFDSNGRIRCSPLPSCGYKEVATSVDLNSLSLSCERWPSGVVDAGSGIISGLLLRFGGGGHGYKTRDRLTVSEFENK
jgi:hypothetical protein